MKNHKNQEGCGFILKKPFVTNSRMVTLTKENEKRGSFEDQIIFKLVKMNKKNFGNYPYIMLQPCMKNRKVFLII